MAMSDWTTGVNTAFEKGVEKGREMAMSDWTTGVNTAIEKNRIEVAQNLLHEGIPLEIIQKTTGLDRETIQSLNGT
jgi:predicted transposase/invertase (TIGR01784 family)